MLGTTGCVSLHRTEGRAALDQFRYQDALSHFDQVLQKRPSDTEAMMAMADAYYMINRHDSARAQWQRLAAAQALPPTSILPYAQSLMALGEYESALGLLNLNPLPQDSSSAARAAALRESCIRVLNEATPKWEVVIREVEVPGLVACGGIDFYQKGFVLTGQTTHTPLNPDDPYTGLSYANLYRGALSDDLFHLQVTPWKEVNGPYHDGYAAIDDEGRRVAWSRNNTGTGKSLRVNAQQTSTIQIYFALSDSTGSWSRPVPFPFNEEDYNFAHPTWLPLSDGIIFASDFDGPGAQGGMDLWYTLRNGDFWSEPVNLGSTINTPGDELFPFLHGPDSLFFSSDGHPTLGGLDLQLAIRSQKDTPLPHTGWSAPRALPTPLNSPADDFGLRLDTGFPGNGYLASDRNGMDRLYRFGLTQEITPTVPLVSDSIEPIAATPNLVPPSEGTDTEEAVASIPATTEPIDAALPLITNVAPSSPFVATELRSDQPLEPLVSNFDTAPLNPNEIKEALTTSSTDSTLSTSSVTSPPPLLPQTTPAEMAAGVPAIGSEISWPKDFELPEIYWDLDKANVRKTDEHPLEELAQLLISNPHFHLEIHSHCDSRGTFEYNVVLAQRRAEAVKKQLLELGVPNEQMHSIGFGEYRLRNGCSDGVQCTEAEHQYNRRTEFRLVEPR